MTPGSTDRNSALGFLQVGQAQQLGQSFPILGQPVETQAQGNRCLMYLFIDKDVDKDVTAHFQGERGPWQERMNAIANAALRQATEDEETMNRVIPVPIYLYTAEEEAKIKADLAEDPDADEVDWSYGFQVNPIETYIVEDEPYPFPIPDYDTQEPVEIYLDQDVGDYFMYGGDFWEARANEVLRRAAFGYEEPPPGKLISLLLDKDVVDCFRERRGIWRHSMNVMANEALWQAAFGDGKDQVEDTA